MEQPKKRPRGRPPIENPESERFEIRVTPERKARYERAAARKKETLSAWAKKVLDRSSRG
jgi:predicted HicB family RNase H-like nuclease